MDSQVTQVESLTRKIRTSPKNHECQSHTKKKKKKSLVLLLVFAALIFLTKKMIIVDK